VLLYAVQALDPAKYPLPDPYPHKEAAQFFKEPEVTPADQLPPLKWTAPDEEALVAYLVGAWVGLGWAHPPWSFI
jgi:flap endonuclease-1